ncbi:MAG: extracellular solute-binding protein [Rhodospirillales bacterium]|nr:extracellular solute-binding protein [Rhodospirillales bacterium]
MEIAVPLSRRAALAGGCAALAAPFVAAAPARAGVSLVLYAAQHQQVVDLVNQAFTTASGIGVRVHLGEAPAIANQLATEGAHSPADIYFTENSPELTLLDERGLLAPVAPSTLAQVPARWSASSGHWLGVLARDSVLAYNPRRIAPAALPASLLDLARPAWRGRVAFAPTDADTLPLIGALAALHGTAAGLAWLKGMRDNARLYDDDEGVMAAVERGAAACGLANAYYWCRLASGKGEARTVSRLHRFAPGDVGNLINVSGAAVLRSSRLQPAAQRYLAFLVSARMQAALAASRVDFEYPLRPGVAANRMLAPWDSLRPPALTVGAIGDDRLAARLLRQAGLV